MFKRVSAIALLVLLAACGSNPSEPDNAAPQASAQPAPAAATQAAPTGDSSVVVNSTKYATFAVVVTSAGKDVDAGDLDTVRKDLTDEVMSNLKVQSNLRAAPEGTKPDLVMTVAMQDLHYVSVAKRAMLGLFAGHASMSLDLTLQDQKNGGTLWTQHVDTTSSLISGYYGSSTVSQVNALAETITYAVKSKI